MEHVCLTITYIRGSRIVPSLHVGHFIPAPRGSRQKHIRASYTHATEAAYLVSAKGL